MNWKTDSQLELLAHLSPLGCGNILVSTGDYTWEPTALVAHGLLRPLRPVGVPITGDVALRESAAILTEKPFSFSPKANILLMLQFPMLTCKIYALQ